MQEPARRIHPLLFIPGAIFWGLVGVGFATENMDLVGVAVGLAAVCLVTGAVLALRRSAATRSEEARIWIEGKAATAKVIAISSGRGGLNDNPLVDLDLEVIEDGQDPYRAQTSALISLLAIPRIQPGCAIDVRIDPTDRTRLVVDEALTYRGYRA